MKNPTTARKQVEAIKSKLIAKAKKGGLYENFGDTEFRKLNDHENCDPYGTPEQREIHSIVMGFSDWCMNYEGQ